MGKKAFSSAASQAVERFSLSPSSHLSNTKKGLLFVFFFFFPFHSPLQKIKQML